MASAEEPQQRQEQQVKERVHKTKLIQFLGRTTPIVLQNDNGPCPLLAICNVLLLRNNLNLSPDTVEVSQEKLLSLVAERLIDSNSNLDNKDAVYVENQQKNISDAIDLLPRLATGIDVNIKFRRIDDFEFTPECSIFDLLDIPLCHGWIVDPQDRETADAIGSKSYNALTGELVALDTQNEEVACKKNISEEDCVDFAAATTATLGVPSPCLSKATSFDESPRSLSDHQKVRKGDLEEEALVSRALKLSLTTSVGDTLLEDVNGGTLSVGAYGSACPEEAVPVGSVDREKCIGLEDNNFQRPDPSSLDDCSVRSNDSDLIFVKNSPGQAFGSSSQADVGDHLVESYSMESKEYILHNNVVENCSTDALLQSGSALSGSPRRESASLDESPMDISRGVEQVKNQSTTTTDVHESADTPGGCSTAELSCLASPNEDVELSSGRVQHIDASKSLSSIDDDEPIYEGEDRILNSRTAIPEDREPVYEGEMVLGKQPDKSPVDACNARSRDEITPQKGELIKNFLKNNASQLTIHGLFCLRDGLKERELCVFFRNNHFSTMFKFDGELYLLATDQGYINQPDLVWEKLNEVNGDTLFMTGNFREFQVESQTNDAWDEHGAMTSTADYLASIDNSAQEGNLNSDLQLAIALQQQEFEQQPQRRNPQQPSIGSSRLITGPQVPRNRNPPTPRPEAKKEKCTIM